MIHSAVGEPYGVLMYPHFKGHLKLREFRMSKMEGINLHLHTDVYRESDLQENAQLSAFFFLSR